MFVPQNTKGRLKSHWRLERVRYKAGVRTCGGHCSAWICLRESKSSSDAMGTGRCPAATKGAKMCHPIGGTGTLGRDLTARRLDGVQRVL